MLLRHRTRRPGRQNAVGADKFRTVGHQLPKSRSFYDALAPRGRRPKRDLIGPPHSVIWTRQEDG